MGSAAPAAPAHYPDEAFSNRYEYEAILQRNFCYTNRNPSARFSRDEKCHCKGMLQKKLRNGKRETKRQFTASYQ